MTWLSALTRVAERRPVAPRPRHVVTVATVADDRGVCFFTATCSCGNASATRGDESELRAAIREHAPDAVLPRAMFPLSIVRVLRG